MSENHKLHPVFIRIERLFYYFLALHYPTKKKGTRRRRRYMVKIHHFQQCNHEIYSIFFFFFVLFFLLMTSSSLKLFDLASPVEILWLKRHLHCLSATIFLRCRFCIQTIFLEKLLQEKQKYKFLLFFFPKFWKSL